MSRKDVSIPMPEGDAARAFVFTPGEGQGPWPTVLFFMDGPGIRPALMEMGERLASHGYYVLLPDYFWRLGPYEPIDVAKVLGDPVLRQDLFTRMIGSTGPEKSMADTQVFLDWLDKQPEADARRIGTTGYCMGGGFSLRAAGTFPDRIVAAGAFHPGNVATDAPTSPHLLAPNIKAKVLVAGGDQDAMFDDAQCERLAKALKDAGVDAEVTIYRGALHGYAPPDMPVYNREASERHWGALVGLLDGELK